MPLLSRGHTVTTGVPYWAGCHLACSIATNRRISGSRVCLLTYLQFSRLGRTTSQAFETDSTGKIMFGNTQIMSLPHSLHMARQALRTYGYVGLHQFEYQPAPHLVSVSVQFSAADRNNRQPIIRQREQSNNLLSTYLSLIADKQDGSHLKKFGDRV